MALTNAEKQRRHRERTRAKAAEMQARLAALETLPAQASIDTAALQAEMEAAAAVTIRRVDALERLVEAAYGRKIGTMERRAMIDEIEALRDEIGKLGG